MRDTLELLEWPVVFRRLLSLCMTPDGVKAWEQETFLPSPEAIQAQLHCVDALKGIIVRYGDPLLEAFPPDCNPALKRVAKGGILSLAEVREVLQALSAARILVAHFQKNWVKEAPKESQWGVLAELVGEIEIPEMLITRLEGYISPTGELLDSASPLLPQLRKRLLTERDGIQKKLQTFLHHPTYGPALQTPVVTERDGRSVLPVKVEHKSTIPGVIHAGSSSGATIFVEPQAVIELNNKIQKTQADLQQEIQRVLREISGFLETESPTLMQFLEQTGRLDKHAAAARLSRQLNGHAPALETGEASVVVLKQARHPLLVFNQEKVVSNDIVVGPDGIRTILITGPNTGGKTVLLKTIGLCAVMLHAGLHLPAAEGSRMSLFDPILVDIGDQQSISQNLSTFSAHLEKLKSFVADETDLSRGLVLIDEIAAGTDPAEGAALAKAVLDELYEKGAITIITTHLGELKVEAHHHPGYMNASVEFDPESLSPTYRLTLGTPGTSNAITIAQRLGLKPAVIQKARRALSQPTRESASLIEELEQKNRKASEELHKAESFRLSAQDSFEKLELQRQQFQEERRKVIQQFKSSLKTRLIPLEEELKELKDAIRASDIQSLKDMSQRLRDVGRSADTVFGETVGALEAEEAEQALTVDQFKIGEEVRSRKLNLRAEVIALLPNSQELTLQAGNVTVTLPVADIEKLILPRKSKKKPGTSSAKGGGSRIPVPQNATSECDVRGMRVDEAMEKVEKFLDDAALMGYETVGIVHGMGTGALKNAIRDYLKRMPFVKNYYPAEARLGGDGKTVIEL